MVRVVKKNDQNIVFWILGKRVIVAGWHDANLYNNIGLNIEGQSDERIQKFLENKSIYSQQDYCVGLGKIHAIIGNFTSWRTKMNRRVVESSVAAKTHAAIIGHGCVHF